MKKGDNCNYRPDKYAVYVKYQSCCVFSGYTELITKNSTSQPLNLYRKTMGLEYSSQLFLKTKKTKNSLSV